MPEHVELSIRPLRGIPEISAGDDLVALIAAAAPDLQDGDILVVTSKIVSKAEGRIVAAGDRSDAIDAETVRVVATSADGTVRIVESRLGIIAAAAGVDASNTPEGTVLLLPLDPDASARALATGLRAATGARIGVILSDTLGRAWRDGQTDCAIGAGGVHVFEDYRGSVDSAGRPLVVTLPCVADELAAAADLVKRKTTGIPVAVVRGRADLVGDLDLPGARSIVRVPERDLFHTGSREAWEEGYAAGVAASRAPVAAGSDCRNTGIMSMERILSHVRSFDGLLELSPQEGGPYPEIAWGDHFFYYAPDGRVPTNTQPFATIVTKDYPDDAESLLGEGRWRVNIHVGKAVFSQLVGSPDQVDFAEADAFLPHPVYGPLGWIAVVTPGARTESRVLELLESAYRDARTRAERRVRHPDS